MPETKDMTGVLFRNKKKTEGDKRPDYTGRIVVAGVGYWLSAWIKEARDTGQKYMSLSVEEHEGQHKTTGQQRQRQQEPAQQQRRSAAPPPPPPPIDDTPAERDIQWE